MYNNRLIIGIQSRRAVINVTIRKFGNARQTTTELDSSSGRSEKIGATTERNCLPATLSIRSENIAIRSNIRSEVN